MCTGDWWNSTTLGYFWLNESYVAHMKESDVTHMNESCYLCSQLVEFDNVGLFLVWLLRDVWLLDVCDIWLIHTSHMSHTLSRQTSRIESYESYVAHMKKWDVTHMNESCHLCSQLVGFDNVTHINESYAAPMRESHVTHMNESCHVYRRLVEFDNIGLFLAVLESAGSWLDGIIQSFAHL